MNSNAQKHLEWSAQEALRQYDLGNEEKALTGFLSNLLKHPGTSYISRDILTLPLITAAYHEGREQFEEVLLGFIVT